MADRRIRAYYTQGQIQNGLNTTGGEWMYQDGTEYIGQYHRYTTGEVFTESSYIGGISRILIPFVDITNINQQNEIGVDLSKNFQYDGIKRVSVLNSSKPNPAFIQPNQSDISRGYITRFFAIRVNSGDIIEINQSDISNVGSSGGIDDKLYKIFSIRWKISGPVNDVLDTNGNILEYGILDTNIRTIESKSKDYPSIRNYITDYLEFSYQ